MRQSLLSVLVLAVGAGSVPAMGAAAPTVSTEVYSGAGDGAAGLTRLWTTRTRLGDGPGGGWELAAGSSLGVQYGARDTAQAAWESGSTVPFTLAYNASEYMGVRLGVGEGASASGVAWSMAPGRVTDIRLGAWAGAGAAVEVSGVEIDLNNTGVYVPLPAIDLHLSGDDADGGAAWARSGGVLDGFTLRGSVTFWFEPGMAPDAVRLDLDGYNAPHPYLVPDAAGFGVFGFAGLALRRRRGAAV